MTQSNDLLQLVGEHLVRLGARTEVKKTKYGHQVSFWSNNHAFRISFNKNTVVVKSMTQEDHDFVERESIELGSSTTAGLFEKLVSYLPALPNRKDTVLDVSGGTSTFNNVKAKGKPKAKAKVVKPVKVNHRQELLDLLEKSGIEFVRTENTTSVTLSYERITLRMGRKGLTIDGPTRGGRFNRRKLSNADRDKASLWARVEYENTGVSFHIVNSFIMVCKELNRLRAMAFMLPHNNEISFTFDRENMMSNVNNRLRLNTAMRIYMLYRVDGYNDEHLGHAYTVWARRYSMSDFGKVSRSPTEKSVAAAVKACGDYNFVDSPDRVMTVRLHFNYVCVESGLVEQFGIKVNNDTETEDFVIKVPRNQ